jgi:AraC-like DNA-binding protein
MTPQRLLRISDWEKLAREAAFQPAVMAARCPISLRQMQRFFAARFDKTPTEWVRELRCRLARQLIAEGWSNRAVAIELRFANESHVCHDFKRVFGVSPQRLAMVPAATVSTSGPARITVQNHRASARHHARVSLERNGSGARVKHPLRRRASTVSQAFSPASPVSRPSSPARESSLRPPPMSLLNNKCRF